MAMHTSAHTTCMSQTVELCGNAMFILIITFVSLLPERLTPVHVTLRELGQPQGSKLVNSNQAVCGKTRFQHARSIAMGHKQRKNIL